MRSLLRARNHKVLLGGGAFLVLVFALLLYFFTRGKPEETATIGPSNTPTATLVGTPTVTPTFQTFPTAIKATPTPTLTPATPTYDPESEEHRVIILLDNSNSPLEDCQTEAQDPAHSEARWIMRDLTVFVIDLLAELSRRTPEADLKVGIYNVFAPNPREQDDPNRHILLPLQSIHDLQPSWEQRMNTSLETQVADVPGLDIGWLLPIEEEGDSADQDSERPAILTGEGNEIVILITDGYTGFHRVPFPNPTVAPLATPTDTPDDIRDKFTEQLNTLADMDSVSLKVLRFNCPGLDAQGGDPSLEERIYKADVKQWGEWDEDDLGLMTLDLPSSGWNDETSISSNTATNGMINEASSLAGGPLSFQMVAKELLEPLEQTALWLQPPQRGLYGSGWFDGSPVQVSLPANTVSLSLRVVSAAGSMASYHLHAERGGNVHRRPLSPVNPGHLYTLEPQDHALSEIIDAPSDTCGPITWRLEGPPAPAFYWWESTSAEFTVEAMVRDEVINNETIKVAFRVNPVTPMQRALSHLDCYTVRVSLRTAGEPNKLVAVTEFPLRELYPHLMGEYSFEQVAFVPDLHTGLVVAVELLQELNKPDSSSHIDIPQPGDRIAIAWADVEVKTRFEPDYLDMQKIETCERGDGGCIELRFNYASDDYFVESPPQPQIYALSTNEEIDGDCMNYQSYTAARIMRIEPASSADALKESQYHTGRLIPYVDKAPAGQRAWSTDVDAPVLTVHVPLTPSDIITECGYSGLLVQWDEPNDGVPATFCIQEQDNSVRCWPAGIRFYPDGKVDGAPHGD